MIDLEEDLPGNEPRNPLARIPIRGALALEGAVMALRMIDIFRLHRMLIDPDGDIEDRDVLALVGLRESPGRTKRLTMHILKMELHRQRECLERRFKPKLGALSRNIDRLGDLLRFGQRERFALRLSVIASVVPGFGDLLRVGRVRTQRLNALLERIAGRRLGGAEHALGRHSRLHRAGLLECDEGSFRENPLEMDAGLAERLTSEKFEIDNLIRRLVRPGAAPSLAMADFPHIPDVDLLARYLRDAKTHRRRGANVLIYGAPGTGKSEFVRAFARESRHQLFEVPNEDSDGDPISGSKRFRAYALCQQLLVNGSDQMLLFDEVEDVFGSHGNGFLSSFFGGYREPHTIRKSWVNEILESNPVPTVWVCNSIGAMDPAYLRRFDIIMEFKASTRAVRQRLVRRYFRENEITPLFAERLAGDERIVPAHLERASRVMRTLRARTPAQREAEVERLLTSSLRAAGMNAPLAAAEVPAHYDLAFLNASMDLSALAAGLDSGRNARICLYGPPGTGKTAFAHYLGRRLDRPALVRRASDLLSMWVGGTEKKIAEAFAQAKDENAILVIDEADSFLRDRAGVRQGWEVTQVNELLTQMEAFDGIFVASTNLVDTLDAASLRRFDFKLKFDYLNREQRRHFLACVCADADGGMDIAVQRLDRLDCLTPGDFANALRQLRVRGVQFDALECVELLENEVALKPEGRKRPMGFV